MITNKIIIFLVFAFTSVIVSYGQLADYTRTANGGFVITNGSNVIVSGTIRPHSHLTGSLGSPGYLWSNLYANEITLRNVSLDEFNISAFTHIQDLVDTTTLIASNSYTNSTQLLLFKPGIASGSTEDKYNRYFLYGKEGDVLDGKWVDYNTNLVSLYISTGQGIWMRNTSENAITTTISGLVFNRSISIPITEGLNFISYPFPTNMTLDEMFPYGCGAYADESTKADNILIWRTNVYVSAFLNNDDFGDPNIDWKWCYNDDEGTPASCSANPLYTVTEGGGFFYLRRGDSDINFLFNAPTGTLAQKTSTQIILSTNLNMIGLQYTKNYFGRDYNSLENYFKHSSTEDMTLNKNLLPESSNTYDLGSELYPWRTGWFHTVKVSEESLYIGNTKLSSTNGELTVNSVELVSSNGVIDADLLSGYNIDQIMAVGATYYFWTNMISYGGHTGRMACVNIPPFSYTSTYAGVTSGQYFASYIINSNALPALLGEGIYTFRFHGNHNGNVAKSHIIKGELYIIDGDTLVTNYLYISNGGDVEVPDTASDFTLLIAITNDINLSQNDIVLLKTKLASAEETTSYTSYFGAPHYPGFTIPKIEGLYATKFELSTYVSASNLNKIVSTTNSYNNTSIDRTIVMYSTNNVITNFLPTVSNIGQSITVKRFGTNNVVISTTSGEYIDNDLTNIILYQNLQCVTLQSDGDRWFIIGEVK